MYAMLAMAADHVCRLQCPLEGKFGCAVSEDPTTQTGSIHVSRWCCVHLCLVLQLSADLEGKYMCPRILKFNVMVYCVHLQAPVTYATGPAVTWTSGYFEAGPSSTLGAQYVGEHPSPWQGGLQV